MLPLVSYPPRFHQSFLWENFQNITSSPVLLFNLVYHLLLLLLLLSHFSCVRLYVTPWTAAHQAPPSLGFFRLEHWSGLPFSSPMQESEKWKWSCSVMSDSLRPHGLQPTRLLHPWDFPGKARGPQMEETGCKCQTFFISLLSNRRKQTLKCPIFFFPFATQN